MILALDLLIIAALSAVAVRTILLVAFACLDLWRQRQRRQMNSSSVLPPVTVVVPAFNEEETLEQTVMAILESHHPAAEILIVDDGSTDNTAAIANDLAKTWPVVRCLSHTQNRGKSAALNSAFRTATSNCIVTVDADTEVDPRTVGQLVEMLVERDLAAVAGNVKVANRGLWLGLMQSIEYVTNLNLDRRAQSWIGAITTVQGATSCWLRDRVLLAGGFSGQTVAEDTDLTLTLHRAGWSIGFAPQAVAHTRTPSNLVALFRQRRRWLYGNLQCAWKHRGGFVDGPGALRWFGLPNFLFAHLFAYALFPLGLAYLGRAVDLLSPLGFVAVSITLFSIDLALSAFAYLADSERKRELICAPLQRLLFPFFLWSVFAVVVTRFLSRRPVVWSSGLEADASEPTSATAPLIARPQR